MSSRIDFAMFAVAALLLAAPALAANNGQGPPVTTVRVDCDQGQSINKALERPGQKLVVEISGFCNERVEFRRSNVTLIGTDPATDGITGPALGDVAVDRALVRISDSRGVRLENLTITGSESRGLEGVSSAFLDIVNCRIVGNDGRGLQMGLGSAAFVEDSEIADNGDIEIITFSGGDVRCTRGAVSDDDGIAVAALRGALMVFNDSTISTGGSVGVYSVEESTIYGTDSDVADATISLYSSTDAQIQWTGGQIDGSVWSDFASRAYLFGVTQAGNPVGNSASEHSHFRVDGGTLVGDTRMTGFSNATLEAGVSLGSVSCDRGGDAFCDGSVTKSSSSCGLCP